jgi:hypothetical protein
LGFNQEPDRISAAYIPQLSHQLPDTRLMIGLYIDLEALHTFTAFACLPVGSNP